MDSDNYVDIFVIIDIYTKTIKDYIGVDIMYLKFHTAIHLCSVVALSNIWILSYQVYVIVISYLVTECLGGDKSVTPG